MRKIFVFWIIFLIALIVGIVLAVASKSTLKTEERRAQELRDEIISRPSILPKQRAVSKAKTEEEKVRVETLPPPAIEAPKEAAEPVPAEPVPSASGEIPAAQNDIPVEINTNSLEISVPSPAPKDEQLQQSSEPLQEGSPAAGQ